MAQVASLSASIEGRAALTKTDVVRVLVRLIGDANQSYVKDAMTALINLAEVPALATQMVDRNVVSRVLDLLLESSDAKLMPLYTILLSNVTRIPNGARKLLNLDEDASLKGYYLSKLLPLFLSEPSAPSGAKAPSNDLASIGTDNNAWLGSILVNATTLPEGRAIFTDKENRFLKLLIPQLGSKTPLRRRASLGVMRNCMFEHKDHEWVLQDEMDMLTEVLLLIRGPEPFEDAKDTDGMSERLKNVPSTKKREDDIECKKLIADILTLFTATRFGRDQLKKQKAYPIVREFDREEKNETVSQKLYDLVHVLLLDDPEDEEAKAQTEREYKEAEAERAKLESSGAEGHSSTSTQSSTASSSSSSTSSSSNALAPSPSTGHVEVKAPPKLDIDEYGEEIEEL